MASSIFRFIRTSSALPRLYSQVSTNLKASTLNQHPSSRCCSNTSFGDFSKALVYNAERKRRGKVKRETIDESIEEDHGKNLDDFVKKAEALLLHRNYKPRPVTLTNFRTVLEDQKSTNLNHWLRLFLKRPELFHVPSHQMQTLLSLADFMLVKMQFSKSGTFLLLSRLPLDFIYPRMDETNFEELWNRALSNWSALATKLDIPKEEVHYVLADMPEVVLINPDLWEDRLDELKTEYFKEKLTLKSLVINAGSIIFMEDWFSLSEKLDYIIKEMLVDIRDLAENATVLFHDLDHIKTRYLFLKRAGMYKYPSAKDLGASKSALPLINEVLLESDEEFINKVVGHGITLEDYETFRKILASEGVFGSELERQVYEAAGYHDEDVSEDLEQAIHYKELSDRRK